MGTNMSTSTSTGTSIRRWWLTLQWWCIRIGIVRALTLVLCLLAVSLASLVSPHIHLQEKNDRSVLALARRRLQLPVEAAAVSATPAPDHLAKFYDALGDSRHAEQQLKTLFDLAQRNNVRLSAAEYKNTADKNSRIRTVQITLPVKAPYPALRQFAEQVLLTIPFASLDELRFKRDSIGSPLLEAHLHFSLYLLERPANQPSVSDLVP